MRPLRHSASFPFLTSEAAAVASAPPSPQAVQSVAVPARGSNLTSHHSLQRPQPQHPLASLSSSPALARSLSPSSSPPAPSAASSSALYSFPSSPLLPPPCFALVECGLYRCCLFSAAHHPFLASLRLRGCLCLTAEPLPHHVTGFLLQQRIGLFQPRISSSQQTARPSSPAAASAAATSSNTASALLSSQQLPSSPLPLSAVLKPALEYLLRAEHSPLLLLSPSPGLPSSCCEVALLVGCLRSLQGWSYSARLEEYARYSRAAAGSSSSSRRWLDHLLLEAGWADAVWVDDGRTVRWWREAGERQRRQRDYRRRKQRAAERQQRREDGRAAAADFAAARADSAFAEIDASLDRLLGSNPQWRVATQRVRYDPLLSILMEDDD